MSHDPPNPGDRSGLTYFYDFIRTIRASYPEASFLLVLEEIAFARQWGPIEAELRTCEPGVFEMIVPLGYGHKARVELEFDRKGRLQPVMGEIIQG